MSTPGWYQDPEGSAQLRYFDGASWTEHYHQDTTAAQPAVAPAPQPPAVQRPAPPQPYAPQQQYAQPQYQQPQQAPLLQQNIQVNQVVATQEKSVGIALLLTFFFGPLGMLYSTVVGGLVMMGLGLVLGVVTFGLWFFVAWPIQLIWAGVAASQSKQSAAPGVGVYNNTAPPPAYQQPQQYAQPQQYQQPAQPQAPAPQQYSPPPAPAAQPAQLPPQAPAGQGWQAPAELPQSTDAGALPPPPTPIDAVPSLPAETPETPAIEPPRWFDDVPPTDR